MNTKYINRNDMPEFKNYVSYSGNKEQLERYAAELIKAGFTPEKWHSTWDDGVVCVISYEDGEFGFHRLLGSFSPMQFSSDQYAEALKAATEPA